MTKSTLRQRLGAMISGAEVCDPRPLKIQTGLKKPVTQEQRLRVLMAQHSAQLQEDQEYRDETDFSDEDDNDMLSPYERSALIYDMEPMGEDEYSPATPAPIHGADYTEKSSDSPKEPSRDVSANDEASTTDAKPSA